MSFRDNLQHLRATRNMTQEQLAMLLGVSRQSVTKWEAEKSYPEMDKLLKMCQIFECSLDDLVQGDLTSRPREGAVPGIPTGPPTDICGYDEHTRRFSRQISLGVAAIILGCAGAAFAGEDGGLFVGPLAETAAVGLLFLFILAGLAFIIPAGMEHSAFCKAHPYIEDFYTHEDKEAARGFLARCLIAGIGVIFAGIIVVDLLEKTRYPEGVTGALMLVCIAAGAGMIVYGGMMFSRVNVAERNRDALGELEVEDIEAATDLTDAQREELLAAKRGPQGRKQRVIGSVCGIIMLVATIIALCWLFGAIPAGGPGEIDWGAWSTNSMFWLPWPIGGICCGIASIAIEAFWRDE